MEKRVNPMGYKMGDTFRQVKAFDNARIAEAKSNLVRKVITAVQDMLRKDFGTVNVKLASEALAEVAPFVYSGAVGTTVGIATDTGDKEVPLNVNVEKSEVVFKNPEHLTSRIKEQLKTVKSSLERKIELNANKSKEKIKAIELRAAEDVEILKRVTAGEDLDEVTASVRNNFIPKVAAEYAMGDGFVVDDAVNSIPSHISYNKQNLPSTLKEGDVININGFKYEITGSEPALSVGKNDGSRWQLRLQVQK